MRTAKWPRTLALAVFIVGCGSNNPSTTGNTGGTTGNSNSTATDTTTGTGATTTTGTGATTATGGGADAGGTTATSFQPLCSGLTTAAGGAPSKGGACSSTDPQLCYKTCGPESKGFKSETCTSGSYAEQSGCTFPAGDYSCYKIPGTVDPTCPTTAPQASQACTVAKCVICAGTTGYLDSTGASKTGYCVCPQDSDGNPTKWSCASTTAWPCPSANGC